jgi:cytoskeleton protein RodZ
LETVGQDLRKARQRKGEDLAHISRILKIRKDHLDGLEESNFDALPGRAYTIGFVRTYAQYLGLDGRVCVERVKKEIAGRGDTRDGAVQVSSPRERKLPQGGIVFAVLLAIALVYGIYYLFVAVNRLASEPVTPVPARLAAQAGLAPTTPAPMAVEAASLPAAEALPQGVKYGAQTGGSRITVLAHRPARVTVLGPNKSLFLDRQLQPGDSYLVPDTAGLVLSASDGGALELILDGQTIGYAGKDGVASEGLPLNAQDVADRRARG